MMVGTMWSTGCKYGLGNSATGSWARDIYQRVGAEQEQSRHRALLQDQLAAGGLRASLWISVKSGETCSCYKESTTQADRKCSSCHGVVDGLIPGYNKFGYNTLFMSAVDTDVTFTNTEITTTWKSSKVQLTEAATTGTVESGDKPFTRSAIGSVWEYNVDSFVRDTAGSSVTTEYSLDSGSTWTAIASLVTANPSSGTIRFRVTLTRSTTSNLSPLFEIIRARYETINRSTDGRRGPWILALRQPPTETAKKSEYGDIPNQGSIPLWCGGLGMFDPSIVIGSSDELLEGPGIVFEMLDGVHLGEKLIAEAWQLSDPFGEFTVQNFKVRLNDPSGHYSLIW